VVRLWMARLGMVFVLIPALVLAMILMEGLRRLSWSMPAAGIINISSATTDVTRPGPYLIWRWRRLPPARHPRIAPYAGFIDIIARYPHQPWVGSLDYDLLTRRWWPDINIETNLRERRRCKGNEAHADDRFEYNTHVVLLFLLTHQ